MLVWVSCMTRKKRGLRRIQNHIKLVDSTDNSVYIIMFRPAYFVILFAVVLCVNALPAPQVTRAPELPSGGSETGLAPKQPTIGSDDKATPAKRDLDTDATEYWGYRYNYYVPTYDPVPLAARVYGSYWPTVYY